METSPARREAIKSSVAVAAGQRRRKLAVTLGRGRREAAVRAKRIRRDEADDESMEIAEDDEAAWDTLAENTKAAVQELSTACHDISKGASRRKLEALKKLRRSLSTTLPPADAAVQAGAVPLLVECLRFGSSEEQLLEAAWCLTNIACGDVEETRAVLPAVPLLIAHLGEKSSPFVAEQCAWALGNVAGDSTDSRDTLLAQGALRQLARLISSGSLSLATTACWAVSNLIKGPGSKAVSDLVKLDGILESLLQHLEMGDESLVAEAAWVLVYISSLSDIQIFIDRGMLPQLVKCLVKRLATSQRVEVLTPVLRTIGNMVAGDDNQTEAVIAGGEQVPGGVVEALVRCVQHEKRTLQKEGAWVLSNIASGSLKHKQLVFTIATPSLVHLLRNAAFDVRKEAAYALGNMCVVASESRGMPQPILDHLGALVHNCGCVPDFVNLVKLPDVETSKLGLQFLDLVMRALPEGPKLVESCDGMQAIEMLQFHENEELRRMANHLMDSHFNDEYGLEEEYGPDVQMQLSGRKP